jgi:hypothetical protein
MGNTFKPFSFYGEINSDTLEEYHYQALCKAKEIHGEVKDISCDSLTLDIMVGEDFKKYDLGMYDDKVAMQSETGEVIVVCDTIK